MKRIPLTLLLALSLALTLTACGNSPSTEPAEGNDTQVELSSEATSENTASETETVSDGGDVLVIFFSGKGTTRGVAERLAAATGGDLYEIVPAQPYTDADQNYNDPESRTSLEQNDPGARPELAGESIDPTEYATVYLGYPIWWGQAPRILSSFVESHDFTGCTVIPFCTSGSSPIGNSGKILADQAGTGTWLEGMRFDGGVSEADLSVWADSMGQEVPQ